MFEEITDDDSSVSVSGGRGGPKFGKAMNLNTSKTFCIRRQGNKERSQTWHFNDELQEILSYQEGDEIIIGPQEFLRNLKMATHRNLMKK